MKLLIFLTVMIHAWAQADCPLEVTVQGQDFCVDIHWESSEKKIRGQFEDAEALSPHLVPMGEIPQKWLYSRALIVLWNKSDSNQTPVQVPDFRVFPYMHMKNGHHHSAEYDFYFDSEQQAYVFRRVAFRAMPGCWSLRWTTDLDDFQETSALLQNITGFSNLSPEAVAEQEALCQSMGQ